MTTKRDRFAASVRSTFQKTEKAPAAAVKATRAKPTAAPAAPGADVQVTLYMAPDMLMRVDQLLLKLRPNFPRGSMMKRAGLVRAALAAILDSGLDLSDARSEDDVRAILKERLGK